MNPTSPKDTPQTTSDNIVWISKEEYEHLRYKAEGEQLDPSVVREQRKTSFYIYGGALLASIVFTGFAFATFPFFAPTFVIAVIIFIILALRSLVLSGKKTTLQKIAVKRPIIKTSITAAAIILGIAIAAPFVFLVVILIFITLTFGRAGS